MQQGEDTEQHGNRECNLLCRHTNFAMGTCHPSTVLGQWWDKMYNTTFAERILSLAFVLVICLVNFLAFKNMDNDAIMQAALGINSSVIGGFIALQTQRREPPSRN